MPPADNKESIKELQKTVQEIKSEDILSLVVSVKTIEQDVKYIKESITDIKKSNDKFDDRINGLNKDIGNMKIWFIPIAFMWAVLATIIGWILKQQGK